MSFSAEQRGETEQLGDLDGLAEIGNSHDLSNHLYSGSELVNDPLRWLAELFCIGCSSWPGQATALINNGSSF